MTSWISKSLVVALVAIGLNASSAAPASAPPSFDRDVQRITLPTGKAPGPVAFGDFNRDGRTDIAVGNTEDATVTIYLNQGGGKFVQAAGSPFATAGGGTPDIGVGDFNNDGIADLAIPNHGTKHVTILLGKGDGSFAPSVASPITVESRPHPHGIALGDFNHDGNPDFAIDSWAEDKIEVFFGDGRGGFRTPGTMFAVGRHPYERLRAGDFNGDGNADIVTTNFEGANVTVLLGDGHGGFHEAPGSPFPTADDPFGAAICDLNRDGKLDLAIQHFSGQGTDFSKDAISILYGDGAGHFRRGPTLQTGHAPVTIACGDVDGDGSPDIAVPNMSGNSITVLLNHGGEFQRSDIPAGAHPEGIGIANLLGSKQPQIVVTSIDDNTVQIITLAPAK